VRVLQFGRRLRAPAGAGYEPPLTVMKPLCGPEEGLAENLRSFCRQDYGTYQIVFGVADSGDPAIAVVESIRGEFPECDIALVVDPRLVGVNRKAANLANMLSAAKHDILVISDSDMRVLPDYLARVAAPFADRGTGAVTCLYAGNPRGKLPSRLGAMFINDWFFPSSLIPPMFGDLAFCFGATMAVRRTVLNRFGGFEALAEHVADDYMLGHLTVRQGYRIALAPCVVENVVCEPSFRSLFLHELRWARTIRSVQPAGFALAFVTEALPLSLLAALAVHAVTASAGLAAVPVLLALSMRLAVHAAAWRTLAPAARFMPWLIPLRDLYSFCVRVASFFGRQVHWREQVLVLPPGAARTALIDRQQIAAIHYDEDPVSQSSDV
jgi:ceramide glucosyltransferase